MRLLQMWLDARYGDPRLYEDTGPMVQHNDVQTRRLDGQSGQQETGHYGCAVDRLGSPLQMQISLRHLDECAIKVAHKLSRAEGSTGFFLGQNGLRWLTDMVIHTHTVKSSLPT